MIFESGVFKSHSQSYGSMQGIIFENGAFDKDFFYEHTGIVIPRSRLVNAGCSGNKLNIGELVNEGN